MGEPVTGAEVELAILVARGVIAAGTEIYRAIVGTETAESLLARARAEGHKLPVREAVGTWDADLDARLARGGGDARPLGERATEPPTPLEVPGSPFEDE